MAKTKKAALDHGLVPPGGVSRLDVQQRADEKIGRTLARVALDPQTRNASLAIGFGGKVFGERHQPDIMESSAVVGEEIERALKGNLALATRIFTSHAISLDALFTEMARRSGLNMGEFPDAADRYMRLALKAQFACRATVEALTRLHQPREQTVKHVHVNEGGQAVVAEHVHHHAGGVGNGKSVKQSHATGATCASAPLPGADARRDAMPIPSRQGPDALSHARRHQPGSAKRQSKCT